MFVLAFISFSLVPGSAMKAGMYGERVHVGTAKADDQTSYANRQRAPVRKFAHVAKRVKSTPPVQKVKRTREVLKARAAVGGARVDEMKTKTRKRPLQQARAVRKEEMEEKFHSVSDSEQQKQRLRREQWLVEQQREEQERLRREHQWLVEQQREEQERLRREHQWLAREQQREQERLKREQEEQQRLAKERQQQIESDHAYALELQKEQEKKDALALKRRQKAAELVKNEELKLENMKEWYSKLRELAPISDEVKESFKTLNKEAAEAKVISIHDIKTAILQRFPNSHMVRCFHDNTKSTVQYDRRGIHVLRGGYPISKKAVTEIYEKRMLPRALKWQQSKNEGEHFFCCRDFASVFTAVCKEEQIIATNCPEQFAIGEVMLKGYFPHLSEPVDMFGHNGCHMINIICDRDAENNVVVHLLEPQSGNFIEPGSFENYDNGIMFVVF